MRKIEEDRSWRRLRWVIVNSWWRSYRSQHTVLPLPVMRYRPGHAGWELPSPTPNSFSSWSVLSCESRLSHTVIPSGLGIFTWLIRYVLPFLCFWENSHSIHILTLLWHSESCHHLNSRLLIFLLCRQKYLLLVFLLAQTFMAWIDCPQSFRIDAENENH